MKKVVAALLTVSIPCLLFLIVWQSSRYALVEGVLEDYDRSQYLIIAENKRKISGISVLTKPERIERVAVEELKMEKAVSADIIRLTLQRSRGGEHNVDES